MKRFLIDFILVLILVIIGSSFNEMEPINDQIKEYEETLQPNQEDIVFSNSNKATLLAHKSGETIENIVGISVEVISSIFKAIVE